MIGKVISVFNNGSFGDIFVKDKGRFNFGGGELVVRYVDNIINLFFDLYVIVIVLGSIVIKEEVVGVRFYVSFKVFFVVFVDGFGNIRLWFFGNENIFYIVIF